MRTREVFTKRTEVTRPDRMKIKKVRTTPPDGDGGGTWTPQSGTEVLYKAIPTERDPRVPLCSLRQNVFGRRLKVEARKYDSPRRSQREGIKNM